MNVNSIIMKIENKKPIPINEPFLDILMMYKNKKSKKVGYARTQLMRRYEGQSYVRQHAILREFLRGDRKACTWAARPLRYDWRESFAEAIAQRWESTPSVDLAITAVLHLPIDYVNVHQAELSRYVDNRLISYRIRHTQTSTL